MPVRHPAVRRPVARPVANAARLLCLTLLLSATVACGRDDLPGSPAPTPALTVRVEPAATVTVAGGAPRSLDLTIARGGGVGAVTLTVDGLPVGVTATVTPSVLPPGTSTATLLLTAVVSAPPGEYPLSLRAVSGATVASVPLMLVVQPRAGFSVALEAWSPLVRNGDTVRGTLRVTREGGYTGPIAWSADGMPSGFAVAFSAPVADSSDDAVERTRFALSARPTVLPQDYTVLLTATGADSVPARTASIGWIVPPQVGGVGGGVEVRDLPAPNQDSVRLEFYTTLQVNRGGTSASRTVRVRRLPPYDGPIFLSGSDTLGYSFSFSRTVIPPGDSTATFTVSAVPGVPSELLTLGVTASAVGAAPMVVLVAVIPVPFR